MYVRMYVCMHTCLHPCMHACMHEIHADIHACMCIGMCILYGDTYAPRPQSMKLQSHTGPTRDIEIFNRTYSGL